MCSPSCSQTLCHLGLAPSDCPLAVLVGLPVLPAIPACPLSVPQDLLSIVASVLHLGNTHFAADEESNAQVTTEHQLKYLSRVSGVSRGLGQSAGERGLCGLTRPTPTPGSSLEWKAQHCGRP